MITIEKKIYQDGTTHYLHDGKFHNEDAPAIIHSNGTREWWNHGKKLRVVKGDVDCRYKNNRYHNDDGPAISTNIYHKWYQHGRLHRIDGPAIIYMQPNVSVYQLDPPPPWYKNNQKNFIEEWWKNGKRHREDGPAITRRIGPTRKLFAQEWWKNGKRHRDNGKPAIDGINSKEWWENDERHRENGPAVVYADGSREWWNRGNRYRKHNKPCVVHTTFKEWWKNNLRHRARAPAIIFTDGGYEYWRNGVKHREDGPAVVNSQREEWWFLGQYHRDDGPAIIPKYSHYRLRWFLFGNEYADLRTFVEKSPVDDKTKMLILLKWSAKEKT